MEFHIHMTQAIVGGFFFAQSKAMNASFTANHNIKALEAPELARFSTIAANSGTPAQLARLLAPNLWGHYALAKALKGKPVLNFGPDGRVTYPTGALAATPEIGPAGWGPGRKSRDLGNQVNEPTSKAA